MSGWTFVPRPAHRHEVSPNSEEWNALLEARDRKEALAFELNGVPKQVMCQRVRARHADRADALQLRLRTRTTDTHLLIWLE